jgi:hypothetical protein
MADWQFVPCFVVGCLMPAPPAQPTVVVCAPLVEWSKPDQQAAAARLKQLPAGDPLRKMGVVLVKQRNLVKACDRSKGQ